MKPALSSLITSTGAAGALRAADFDGSDSVAAFDGTPESGSLTLAAWVYLDALPANAAARMIVYADDEGSGNRRFQFRVNRDSGTYGDSDGHLEFIAFVGGGAEFTTDANPFPVGEWAHVAVTAASGGAVKLYVNGVVVASGSISGAINTPGAFYRIGNGAGSGAWDGGICDVAEWSDALSGGNVALVYKLGPLFVSPSTIVFFANLTGRESAIVPDFIGKLEGTATNLTERAGPAFCWPNRGI